jgi:alpha-D-ribose 1-methylphosphonate 5-triphosphate synthase subunit PhnI
MNAEEAIPVAIDAVKKLFPAGTDHRLEEILIREDGGYEITISYRTADSPRPMTLGGGSSFYADIHGGKAAIGIDPSRMFKDVTVTPDGVVKSVRMRQIVVG